MITVKIDGTEAQINNSEWVSESKALASLLNNWTQTNIKTATSDSAFFMIYSPENPDPDYTIATEAVKVWGGEIIDEGDAPEYDPEDIY